MWCNWLACFDAWLSLSAQPVAIVETDYRAVMQLEDSANGIMQAADKDNMISGMPSNPPTLAKPSFKCAVFSKRESCAAARGPQAQCPGWQRGS
jgi:hypothetical protein